MNTPAVPPTIRPPRYRARWPWVLAGLVVLFLIFNLFFGFWPFSRSEAPPLPPEPETSAPAAPAAPSPAQTPVIDYNRIEQKNDRSLEELIADRKKQFGLSDSVDMVVSQDEAIQVGGETVPLKEILAEISQQAPSAGDQAPETEPPSALSGGAVTEESLSAAPTVPTSVSRPVTVAPARPVTYYGVYVVRPSDNLWDIHFTFLRDYLGHRGVRISPLADEGRDAQGRSTGVARILKYAESMVHIFNLKTRKLDYNLDLLEPRQKVVVFNLTHMQAILDTVPPDQMDRLRFDGRDLYIPSEPEPVRADG